MKKNYPLIILLFSFFYNHTLWAQCTPNQNYTSPGLYPDYLPDATVGQFYSKDITIVFFKDTTSNGITCQFDEFEILDISSLPPGMSWVSNSGNDKYYPQQNIYGCVNISGTPMVKGSYTIVATGNTVLSGGGGACGSVDGNITYMVPFEVVSASAANSAFTMSATSGCAPLTVDFATSNNLTGNYDYLWEFGDANTTASVVENPSFTYTQAGTYVIKQTATNIDPVKYVLSGITIEELPDKTIWEPGLEVEAPDATSIVAGFYYPDVYIRLYDSSNKLLFGYDENKSSTNDYFKDQLDPALLPIGFPIDTNYQYLSAQVYKLEVYDRDPDNLGLNDDDFLGSVSFYGNGASSTETYSFGSDGKLKVTFTLNNTAVDPIEVTDTVVVYPTPDLNLTSSGLLEFCEGDSVTLISDQTSGNQWYGDSTLLFGEDTTYLTIQESGTYYVIVTNEYGCTDTSDVQTVVVNENPPTPNFWYYNDTLWTSLTGYDLQWYLDGVAIQGANESYCPITATGAYSLEATSTDGCTSMSASSNYTFTPANNSGIYDMEALIQDFSLYPNPSNGQFNIEFEITSPKNLSIVVEDVIGKKVLDIPLSQVHGKINQNINLSYISKGLYYVGINVDEKLIRKKMIIE
jgi:PKD repeat protein